MKVPQNANTFRLFYTILIQVLITLSWVPISPDFNDKTVNDLIYFYKLKNLLAENAENETKAPKKFQIC